MGTSKRLTGHKAMSAIQQSPNAVHLGGLNRLPQSERRQNGRDPFAIIDFQIPEACFSGRTVACDIDVMQYCGVVLDLEANSRRALESLESRSKAL